MSDGFLAPLFALAIAVAVCGSIWVFYPIVVGEIADVVRTYWP